MILNWRRVPRLKKLGILIPLLLCAVWVVGFYVPGISRLFYETRWPASILLGLLAIFRLFGGVRGSKNSVVALTLGLVGLCFVSSLYSFMPVYTILRSASALLLILAAFVLPIAVMRSVEDIQRAFYALVFLYLCLAIVILVSGATDSFAFASDRFQGNEHLKATGTGNIIASAVIFFIWGFRNFRFPFDRLFFLLAAVLAVAIVATRSRVPIGGALLLWPFAWVVCKRKSPSRAILYLLGGLALIGLSLVMVPETANFLRINPDVLENQGYDISSGRFSRWETLYEEAWNSPITGHGFGTSRYVYLWTLSGQPEYMEWSREINNTLFQVLAHNQHIQIFFELGIVGLALFWIACLVIIRTGIRVMRFHAEPYALMIKLIFLSVLYHLIDTWSHDGLLTPRNLASYVFWFKVGVLVKGRYLMEFSEMPTAARAQAWTRAHS